jgi:hypothetical protein
MKTKRPTDDVKTETIHSKPSTGAHDFSPSRATLITSRRHTLQRVSLYESESGQFFVVMQDASGQRITPVTPAAAGNILVMETARHMSRIFRKQFEVPAIVTIKRRKLDTTKDAILWMHCDDEIEAAAVYRTAQGVEYLRLVNPWHDLIVLFKKSGWEHVQDSVAEWLHGDRSLLTLLDSTYLNHNFDMLGASYIKLSRDSDAWIPETDPC